MNWLTRFRYRGMLPLAELLDDQRFEVKGGKMMGLYHGRSATFIYLRQENSKEFHVVLSCRSAFSCMIQKSRKRKRGKQVTLYGVRGTPDRILSSVEIGDPELDRQLVFWSDSPQSFTDWMGRPGVKENVASLVLAERVYSLRVGPGALRVEYTAGSFSVVGFIPGSGLIKEDMTPRNVTLVLQKLETLAQSLES